MDLCMSVAAQLMLPQIENGSSKSKNVILSPIHIAIVLYMLTSGSNGETLDQFLRFLGAKDIEELTANARAMMFLAVQDNNETSPFALDREQKLPEEPSMANALWIDHRYPLKPRFAEIADTLYKALVKNVDLVTEVEKVNKEVNSWADKETKGLIKVVFSDDTLENGLYFEAGWQIPFKALKFRDAKRFNLLNGDSVKVSFMTSKNESHFFGWFKDFKLLKLPYKQGQCSSARDGFSMYIFLPHTRKGLRDLADKLNADPAALHPKNFHLESKPLSRVSIPKLKSSFEFEAHDLITMKKLKLPFEQDYAGFSDMADKKVFIGKIADFSDMVERHKKVVVGAKGVFFGKIIRKALVQAWMRACCALGMVKRGKQSFVADHPFMFMIIEDLSDLVVFAGAVLNPALE